MTSPEGAAVDNAPLAAATAGAASPPTASALANGVNNNNNSNANNANLNQGNGGGGQALITQLLVRQQQGTLVDDPGGPPCPRASLACRPNSHPFQDRTLSLDQSAKIGRSVARARPAANNAIFDCKVLSRNHALLWYENGKFYLQDTKSSNGTFVNNQRLSKGSEESLPREVCSGDILQFGVDVMENSRKVTHGCIIATLKLFLPDGKEAKASPTIMSSPFSGHLPPQDLYLLNQYIQEALAREQLLESKLAILQRLVGQTEAASGSAWKALIDEDRLLTRVEILESQLTTYSKNMTEDKLREEVQRLMDEKEEYQEMAKETVTKITNDKLSAVNRMEELQKKLGASEQEQDMLKELYERCNEENQKLAEEVARLASEVEAAKKEASESAAAVSAGSGAAEPGTGLSAGENPPAPPATAASENPKDDASETSSVATEKLEEADVSLLAEPAEEPKAAPEQPSDPASEQRTEELLGLRLRLAELEAENSTLREERERPKEVADASTSQENSGRDEEQGPKSGDEETSAAAATASLAEVSAELRKLSEEKAAMESEMEALREELAAKAEVAAAVTLVPAGVPSAGESPAASPDTSTTSEGLSDEERLHHLIKVKEKYVEVTRVNSELERSLHQLEEEVESLSNQNHVATACSLLPLAVLVLAFIVAWLPSLSALFGTAERVG